MIGGSCGHTGVASATSVWRKLRPVHIARKLRAEFGSDRMPDAESTPLVHETFSLWGEQHPYFIHPYNTTWLNERAVEIPAAVAFLEGVSGEGMELGDVLSNYGIYGPREVVDRDEETAAPVHQDILEYRPAQPLGYIVSVSTLEHVGWDDDPRDVGKTQRAFDHLISMLARGGRMLVTTPLGYNPMIDAVALDGRWPAKRQTCLLREADGQWAESSTVEWRPYGGRGRGADAVWIAEFQVP